MKNTFLQFESLGVQKLRRFHNLGSLYSRLYERQQFFDLLTAMARRCKNGKYVIGGAVISGSSGFDWKKERWSRQYGNFNPSYTQVESSCCMLLSLQFAAAGENVLV